jgi:hypothetical protein
MFSASPLHAIRLLNLVASQRFLSDFRDRKQLQHENLLPLLGISYDFGPLPAMVSPWMDNDSLTTYLKCNFTTLTVEIQIQIVSCFLNITLT